MKSAALGRWCSSSPTAKPGATFHVDSAAHSRAMTRWLRLSGMTPVDTATRPSVTGRPGKRRLFSRVVAMTELPSVNGIWGNASSTTPTKRSCLDGRDRAHGLHGLDRKRCLVVQPANQHRNAKRQQTAGRAYFQDADVGHDERDQGAQVAEGACPLLPVVAVARACPHQ